MNWKWLGKLLGFIVFGLATLSLSIIILFAGSMIITAMIRMVLFGIKIGVLITP